MLLINLKRKGWYYRIVGIVSEQRGRGQRHLVVCPGNFISLARARACGFLRLPVRSIFTMPIADFVWQSQSLKL